jgi:LMBR1-like membrane protein
LDHLPPFYKFISQTYYLIRTLAGYFTFIGRLASSFKRMMILNIIGLIVGSIVLGILIKQNVVQQDVSAIELTAIIITNIMYETFLMFLMGYGLIELPRSVWLQGSLESSLLRAQMKACADFEDISEAQTSMSICVANVIRTRNEVRAGYRYRCERIFSP